MSSSRRACRHFSFPLRASRMSLVNTQFIFGNFVDALGIESLLGPESQGQFDTSAFQDEKLEEIAASFHDLQLKLIRWRITDPLTKALVESLASCDFLGQGNDQRARVCLQDIAYSSPNL